MRNKLLLVDDDKEFRDEFKTCFEEYGVVEAATAEDALRILQRPNEIGLVMLDVRLPGLKGTDVLRDIKQIEPGINIIVMTGHSSEDVAVEALRGKADDYIEKPLDIEETKSIIEQLLNAKDEKEAEGMGTIKSKVERAKQFAERNCYKKVCLKDAADAVALSPKYLSRIFKETLGIGFNEFRLEIKTKEAKELLLKTNMNVDGISYKLGYQNTESFIKVFKKITGKTPSEYRRGKIGKLKSRKTKNRSKKTLRRKPRSKMR